VSYQGKSNLQDWEKKVSTAAGGRVTFGTGTGRGIGGSRSKGGTLRERTRSLISSGGEFTQKTLKGQQAEEEGEWWRRFREQFFKYYQHTHLKESFQRGLISLRRGEDEATLAVASNPKSRNREALEEGGKQLLSEALYIYSFSDSSSIYRGQRTRKASSGAF